MATRKKAPQQTQAPTLVVKVVAQPQKPYRSTSARAQYWQRVQQFNGKPVQALAASVVQQPPSVPKHGKLKGQAEPLSGWLSYFKQQGLVTVQATQ